MTERKGTITMALFRNPDDLITAIKKMLGEGRKKMEVLSPLHLPEVDDLLPQRPSRVRWFTFFGCFLGGGAALAFEIITVLLWPLDTGGKRIISIPAFIPIGFEITILVGAIATLLGLFLTAKLPGITLQPYYSGSSQTEFALFIWHESPDYLTVETQLREAGARDVQPYRPASARNNR